MSNQPSDFLDKVTGCVDTGDSVDVIFLIKFHISDWQLNLQESCAIAKMTAQCALHMGALKIFGTP